MTLCELSLAYEGEVYYYCWDPVETFASTQVSLGCLLVCIFYPFVFMLNQLIPMSTVIETRLDGQLHHRDGGVSILLQEIPEQYLEDIRRGFYNGKRLLESEPSQVFWYYFSVKSNVNKRVKFNICNMTKNDSHYSKVTI